MDYDLFETIFDLSDADTKESMSMSCNLVRSMLGRRRLDLVKLNVPIKQMNVKAKIYTDWCQAMKDFEKKYPECRCPLPDDKNLAMAIRRYRETYNLILYHKSKSIDRSSIQCPCGLMHTLNNLLFISRDYADRDTDHYLYFYDRGYHLVFSRGSNKEIIFELHPFTSY